MLRSHFAVAGVAAAAMVLSGVSACGSSTTTTSGTTGGTTTGGNPDVGPPGITPPVMSPTAPKASSSVPVTFAVTKFYFGDTDRNGTADPINGWKQIGFDIDGTNTECGPGTSDPTCALVTNLCKPASGGMKVNVYPDGDNGIDNSFGKNVFDNIISSLDSGASSTINGDIATKGSFTIMLSIAGLGSLPAYNGLSTTLYAGENLMAAPTPGGTWPYIPGVTVGFPNSYLTSDKNTTAGYNTWVSGSKATVNLSLAIEGYNLTLTINSAQIAMDIDSTRTKVTNGTIAGVLNTAQLLTQINELAGSFEAGLCNSGTLKGILGEIAGYSDIMHDGTQDPTQTCDGLSIGLGFDAEMVKLGPAGPVPTPMKSSCAPTGG